MYGSYKPASQEKENIVDPHLEKIDPTPSIFDLFRQFNLRFFWDKLNMVQVSWSGRQMTSCAGLCSFQPRTGFCSIRLSAPLLTLRPRKDLVETLLHEMIHAFLFITGNHKDRNDHGPEFHKHMNRINQEAGTNISVYHTFSDEVRHFKSHVWRCDGPCQKVGPFFGIVRRASNRAPGLNDRWWSAHRNNCYGTFQKIEEPPGYKSKKKNVDKAEKAPPNDLRNFFTPVNRPPAGSNIHTFGDLGRQPIGGAVKNKGTGTLVVTGKPNSKNPSSNVATGKPSSKSPVPLFSPNTATGKPSSKKPIPLFSSKTKPPSAAAGSSLISPPINPPSFTKPATGSNVNQHVRKVWANKYPETATPVSPQPSVKRKPAESPSSAKKLVVECSSCGDLISTGMAPHRDVCPARKHPCPVCGVPVQHGCLELHLSSCLSDSITEDMFGSEVVPEEATTKTKTEDEEQKVACPICGKCVPELKINSHIDECLNLQVLKDIM